MTWCSKKVPKHEMCVIILSTTSSETLLILNGIHWDMITNVYWSLCKLPVILVRLQWNLNFLDAFSKNTSISNFIKICPVGAKLFMWTGKTDRLMTKLMAFSILQTHLKSEWNVCTYSAISNTLHIQEDIQLNYNPGHSNTPYHTRQTLQTTKHQIMRGCDIIHSAGLNIEWVDLIAQFLQ
jgi:hypothetical protein